MGILDKFGDLQGNLVANFASHNLAVYNEKYDAFTTLFQFDKFVGLE